MNAVVDGSAECHACHQTELRWTGLTRDRPKCTRPGNQSNAVNTGIDEDLVVVTLPDLQDVQSSENGNRCDTEILVPGAKHHHCRGENHRVAAHAHGDVHVDVECRRDGCKEAENGNRPRMSRRGRTRRKERAAMQLPAQRLGRARVPQRETNSGSCGCQSYGVEEAEKARPRRFALIYLMREAPPASSTATSAVAPVATRYMVFFTRSPEHRSPAWARCTPYGQIASLQVLVNIAWAEALPSPPETVALLPAEEGTVSLRFQHHASPTRHSSDGFSDAKCPRRDAALSGTFAPNSGNGLPLSV